VDSFFLKRQTGVISIKIL